MNRLICFLIVPLIGMFTIVSILTFKDINHTRQSREYDAMDGILSTYITSNQYSVDTKRAIVDIMYRENVRPNSHQEDIELFNSYLNDFKLRDSIDVALQARKLIENFGLKKTCSYYHRKDSIEIIEEEKRKIAHLIEARKERTIDSLYIVFRTCKN